MKSVWKAFDTTLNYILAICVLAITVICLSQIFARFIINSSISWSDEVCRYLFVITVALGAGVCVRDRCLIAVDLIPQKLNGMARFRFFYILILNILVICIAYVLLVYGYQFAQMNMKQLSSSTHIPMGTVYMVLSLSGLLIIINTLRNIVSDFKELS